MAWQVANARLSQANRVVRLTIQKTVKKQIVTSSDVSTCATNHTFTTCCPAPIGRNCETNSTSLWEVWLRLMEEPL
jgi:hypothetical protein